MTRFVFVLLVCLCFVGWSQEAEAGPFVEPLTLLPQGASQVTSLPKLPMSGAMSGSLVDRLVLSGGGIGEVGVLRQSYAAGAIGVVLIMGVVYVLVCAAVTVALIGNIVTMAGDHSSRTRMGWGIFGIVSGGLGVLTGVLVMASVSVSLSSILFGLAPILVGAGAIVLGSLSIARARRERGRYDGYGRGRRYRRYRRRYRRDVPDGRLSGQVGSFVLPGVSTSSVTVSF